MLEWLAGLVLLRLAALLAALGQQRGVDVGHDAALRDDNAIQQLTELFVLAHC